MKHKSLDFYMFFTHIKQRMALLVYWAADSTTLIDTIFLKLYCSLSFSDVQVK